MSKRKKKKLAKQEKKLEKRAQKLAQSLAVNLAAATAPKVGRSSVEEPTTIFGQVASFNNEFDGLMPVISFEILEFLLRVSIANPDLNHALTNLVNLANNGHTLMIESDNDRLVEKAQARLNEQAKRLYSHSAGVDGLINHYIFQIAVTGAVSSEDVVSQKLDGVEKVVIVPASRIRFKYEENEYRPYQKVSFGDLVPLNAETYSYYAFRTVENSPYAVPLFLSAIEPILAQRDMHKNIKFIMRKFGLLGLVGMALNPPKQKANEMDSEFTSRKERYLSQVLTAVDKNFYQGLMVHYNDQTIEHHNITGDANGSRDIWDLNEQQVASGTGMDPIAIGRSFYSTETFANVTYMFLVRQANNIRRLAKRRMEGTYNLDLRLAGINANVNFVFNENPARDPQAEAQAAQIRQKMVIEKVQLGVIDPDSGAQELGHDEWFDASRLDKAVAAPALLSRRVRKFAWNKGREFYEFVRPRVFLSEVKDRMSVELAAEDAVQKTLKKFIEKYFDQLQPILQDSTKEALRVLEGFLRRKKAADFRDAAHFAEEALGLLGSVYVEAFSNTEARQAIRDAIEETYEYYRVSDKAAFAKAPKIEFSLDAADKRTMTFMRGVDRFYLSKYIYNADMERAVRNFLEERFIEGGDGLFGRGSDQSINDFILAAGEKLEGLTAYEVRRIIDTSVARMRNWANISQLNEAGIVTAEIFNKSPEAEICVYLTTPPNNMIKIAPAYKAVQELTQLSAEDFADKLKRVSVEHVKTEGLDAMVADGRGMPPYHPNCHTRLIAREEGLQKNMRRSQVPKKALQSRQTILPC